MISIFDHLSSILIAMAVALILIAAQRSGSHTSVQQVATHSVKAKTLVFGTWIESDILDLGKNLGTNRYRFETPITDSLGNTRRFHFFSDSTCFSGCSFAGGVNIAAGDTARLHTRYELVPTRQVTLRGADGSPEVRQLSRLDREVAVTKVTNETAPHPAASEWQRDLWSISTLSHFRVEMLDRMGAEINNVEEGDYIHVRFSVVPEWILQPENYIREIYWSTTLKVRPYWDPPSS
ncbi:MAG: hypothetical protein AAF791_12555 [Bacteroidota bacterium]